MRRLLFLVHRLPYPPNKGDKISSYNILRHFSKNWRILLGTFVDDPADWQYIDKLDDICEETCILPLAPSRKVTSSAGSFCLGEPLSVGYYRNRKLLDWVNAAFAEQKVDGIYVYGSSMARFVRDADIPRKVPFILNADDVDSEKWRGYAQACRWPMASLYSREANKLLQFEREMTALADKVVFISEQEARLFKEKAPESAGKVVARKQGVDCEYFDPEMGHANPYQDGEQVFVFTGAMDYRPNIDAVAWFCAEVLDSLRERHPDFVFYIVGMNPTEEVKQLERLPGVRVTGAVPDVRPYLNHALCACLPLRIARGIQNKALEALAMSLPVLASSAAMTGIDTPSNASVFIADDAVAMTEQGLRILERGRAANPAGRDFVREHFNWDTNLRSLEAMLQMN
jgi:sugar transferase (PEP-CTERM/EpsH1 system associated)